MALNVKQIRAAMDGQAIQYRPVPGNMVSLNSKIDLAITPEFKAAFDDIAMEQNITMVGALRLAMKAYMEDALTTYEAKTGVYDMTRAA